MARNYNDGYSDGYQEALSDIANALRQGGWAQVAQWCEDNSVRSPENQKAFRAGRFFLEANAEV